MNTSHQLILAEFHRRVFVESVPRILICLDRLSDEEIWRRPNSSTVSIGNLVLHLCGNARQWILSGLGSQMDERKRQEEFDERGPVAKEVLQRSLLSLEKDLMTVVGSLSENDLIREYEVQVFRESGVAILIHVIEHFSYHTGQISLHTKLIKDQDLGYYSGMNLEGNQK